MRVNISFVDQLELPGRAHEELSGVNQVTDGACSDYRCAVNIIPEWVSVQVSMIKKDYYYYVRSGHPPPSGIVHTFFYGFPKRKTKFFVRILTVSSIPTVHLYSIIILSYDR